MQDSGSAEQMERFRRALQSERSLVRLEELRDEAQARYEKLSSLAMRFSRQEDRAAIISHLKERLQAVREGYLKIDATVHPSSVVSRLSDMQGRERILAAEIEDWESLGEGIKRLDKILEVYNSVIQKRKREQGERA